MKKLKIKFVKSDNALAAQILEQKGLPRVKCSGRIQITVHPLFTKDLFFLRGCNISKNFKIATKEFKSNAERDDFMQKIITSISTEIFPTNEEMKAGDIVEVSDSVEYKKMHEKKLITILP